MQKKSNRVLLDINNPAFQNSWMALEKAEGHRVLDALKKIQQLTWDQVSRDQGLNWEKISSITPSHGIPAIYSIRITLSSRALVYRDGSYIRFLFVSQDHDKVYGKKWNK